MINSIEYSAIKFIIETRTEQFAGKVQYAIIIFNEISAFIIS